jgi:hypothetical protein
MFGLDKLVGGITDGLLGGLFDKIGMPWMKDIISLAANYMTGNWLGAAKDVFDLVSQFSNSFADQIDRNQPLGDFNANRSWNRNNILDAYRMDYLRGRADSKDFNLSRARRAFTAIGMTLAARGEVRQHRQALEMARVI